MECRKRLAKRRMMNLVAAEGGPIAHLGPVVNHGLTFGHREWEWQSPSPQRLPVENKDEAQLPSWLTDLPPPVDPSTLQKLETAPDTLHRTVRKNTSEVKAIDLQQLNKCLSLANDVEGVRRVIQVLELDTHQDPHYSRAIFDHFLARETDVQTLTKFLDDPSINVDEARNFLHVVRSFSTSKRNHIVENGYQWVLWKVKQSLTLGIVSDTDIRELVRLGETVARKAHGYTAIISFYTSIWEGIEGCSVLPIHDLDPRTLDNFLLRLSRLHFSNAAHLLVLRIISSASSTQLNEMTRGVSSYLLNWMHNWRDPSKGSEGHPSNFVAIPGMTAFLRGLPVDFARSCISLTTTAYITKRQQKARFALQPRYVVYPWMTAVAASGVLKKGNIESEEWYTIESMLTKSKSLRPMIPYLKNSSDLETSRFILRHCVKRHLSLSTNNPSDVDSLLVTIQHDFEELCKKSGSGESYCNLLRALDLHNQPYQRVLKYILNLLRDLSRPKLVVKTAHYLKRYELLMYRRTFMCEIRKLGRKKSLSLQLYRLWLRVNRDRRHDVAHQKTDDPIISAPLLFHLLRCSQSTHKAPPLLTNPVTGLSEPKSDLVHRMAVVFAHADQISPRSAFRQVHECFKYLKHHGAALRSDLSRALTYTGITRPLRRSQWVSTMKVRWVLSKVSQIEGPRVADTLDKAIWNWRGYVVRDIMRKRRLMGIRASRPR
ncbi:MAG: hypothetical protein M1827_007237 [Pycnora praestabilis]|nr:MAG: hypothetical protein M1827_007237 [Pycnora praestabilis]